MFQYASKQKAFSFLFYFICTFYIYLQPARSEILLRGLWLSLLLTNDDDNDIDGDDNNDVTI